jgi:RNA polymerase sigma factor (sigma-70 family)
LVKFIDYQLLAFLSKICQNLSEGLLLALSISIGLSFWKKTATPSIFLRMHLNTASLVRQLKSKDKRAIAALYDAYAPALYGIILKIVKAEGPARDALQETFVKIWTKGSHYESSKGTLFTWMLNIARNTAIDKLRQTERANKTAWRELGIQHSTNGHPSVELRVDYIGLQELVHDLDEKYREVIDLIYFKGYTQEEVTEELDIPLGTVKSRLRIALRELRKFFHFQQANPILILGIMILNYHG